MTGIDFWYFPIKDTITGDMSATIYIGTSGWSYDGWKDRFYSGVARKNWLRFCAEQFTAVEVNATFYGLQKRSTFERWHDMTPPDFRFAIKGNRFLTHNKKLTDPGPSIALEKERATGLGSKLTAVLWQLPRSWGKNIERLELFAMALQGWSETRHVMEFRHPSWFDDEVSRCLERYRLAVCLSDAADWPMWDRVTTDLVYIRFHGRLQTYASVYNEEELKWWAERVREWVAQGATVHAYFDNDAECAAPYNALLFRSIVEGGDRFPGESDST